MYKQKEGVMFDSKKVVFTLYLQVSGATTGVSVYQRDTQGARQRQGC